MKKIILTSMAFALGSVCAQASVPSSSVPLPTPRPAASASCQPVTAAQVSALFDRWNAALQTLSPDKVAAEYAPGAVLLPTLSNQVRTNTAQIRGYFVEFLKKRPVGHIDSQTVRLGCNTAVSSGVYTFNFANGSKAQARYSFVYEYGQGEWKIVSHHSSLMPEAAQP